MALNIPIIWDFYNYREWWGNGKRFPIPGSSFLISPLQALSVLPHPNPLRYEAQTTSHSANEPSPYPVVINPQLPLFLELLQFPFLPPQCQAAGIKSLCCPSSDHWQSLVLLLPRSTTGPLLAPSTWPNLATVLPLQDSWVRVRLFLIKWTLSNSKKSAVV